MQKRFLHLIIIIFLSFFLNTYSQSVVANNSHYVEFEMNLNKSTIDKKIKNKILKLIEEREKNILVIKKELEKQNINYPITFQVPEFSIKSINQLFIKSLSEIIDINQFTQLFLPQLELQIQKIANNRILEFTKKYDFTSEQLLALKKMCYQNTENEIIKREYYNYDDTISKDNYIEEKIKSARKELELFESFGLLYSNDSKTDALIKNLQKLNVEPNQINRILTALQRRKERMTDHDRVWRVNDSTCVIDFYDEGDSQFKIDMELREEISKALKIEDFKTLFAPALKNRIDRESLKEFNITKSTYNLPKERQDEIYNLIKEKNTDKIITEEYYKYSYYLYTQKLRAVEYRHEKIIREKIQKIIPSSP